MDYKLIELPGTDGQMHKLADIDKLTVLYFYPKDNTPGCTNQAIQYTAYKNEFEKLGAQIIGVSRDSIKSHEKFIAKHDLNLLLLSDENSELSDAFHVIKEKTMFGKTALGVVRSTFIIGKGGEILQEHRNVNAEADAKNMLNAIKELK
ncbi:peroxiredoxin [Mycoplasma sp. P36-A1]|uniref:peroxiredoxin n=1 Tax=Mycoplasma sp. P36-A1 TaxID=3252900 RepID=UPI003C2BA39C